MDYRVFLLYLKQYLEPKDTLNLQKIITSKDIPWSEKNTAVKLLRLNNFYDTIQLYTYCLMPNHFHFLLKQTDAMSIDVFMNSLCSRYTGFLNKKYHRVGPMFQGPYKAVLIESDEQLLQVHRYIHRNAQSLSFLQDNVLKRFEQYPYSSYADYIGTRDTKWIHMDVIHSFFKNRRESYVEFMRQNEHVWYQKDYYLDNE
jgi:putative transposase